MLIHKEVLRIINERDFHDLIDLQGVPHDPLSPPAPQGPKPPSPSGHTSTAQPAQTPPNIHPRWTAEKKPRTNPDRKQFQDYWAPDLLIQLLRIKVVKKLVMITGHEAPRCRNNLQPSTNPRPPGNREIEKTKASTELWDPLYQLL